MIKNKTENTGIRLQFTVVGGKRKEVFLAKTTSKNYANTFRNTVSRMIQARRLGVSFDPQDQAWLIQQDSKIRKKLVKLGLIRPEDQQRTFATLKAFSEQYADRHNGTSKRKMREVSRRLVRFFGDVLLDSINNADAQRFQEWLVKPKAEDGEGLAETSTARRYIGYCVEIWNAAIADELTLKNPFKQDRLKRTVKTNKSRHFRISPELSRQIFNGITDPIDRLRFVLLRYQGLRAPSEMNELKWSDIDFKHNQITIRSSKTKNDRNSGVRIAGLFPEVRQELQNVAALKSNSEFVLPKIIHRTLTKRVERWLGCVGIERWPQLLINFRRNAVTDAHENWQTHIVAEWFGHCERISQEFYTMRTPEHFEKLRSQKSSLENT